MTDKTTEETPPGTTGDGKSDGPVPEGTVTTTKLRDILDRLARYSGPEEEKGDTVQGDITGGSARDAPALLSWSSEKRPTPTNSVSKIVPTEKTAPAGTGDGSRPGLVNGNGFTNGRGRATGRGFVNGNGLVNGKGLTNGRGLTNGSGLVNGNGLVNGKGLTNGRGLTNGSGLVNGDGLVNGRGSSDRRDSPVPAHDTRRRQKRARLAVAVAIAAAALMTLPAFSLFLEDNSPPIIIDGYFGDWDDHLAFTDGTGDTPSPASDIRTVKIHRWNSHFAVQITTGGNILAGSTEENEMDSFLILVDSDRDAGTGYLADGIGADWLLDVSGMNGRAKGVTVSRFDTSRSTHDWNGWTVHDTGRACARENGLECEFYLQLDTDPLVRVYSFDAGERGDRLDNIISTGPMVLARLEPCAPSRATEGDDIPLARVTILASRGTSLSSLRVGLNTTHLLGTPLELGLREDDGDGGMTAKDTLLATTGGFGELFELTPAVKPGLAAGVARSFWLSAKGPEPYCTIGVETVRPRIEMERWPVAVEVLAPAPGLETKVTVGNPSRIEIDGAFADWKSLSPKALVCADMEDDVKGGQAPDIDIVRMSGLLDDTALHLSTLVKGNALAGSAIPFETHRGPTEASGPSGTPVPSQISPAPSPIPRFGTDRTEFFISTGLMGGYSPEWLASGARYLVAIEGRRGEILCATLERYTGLDGQQWKWERIEGVLAAAGGSGLETALPRDLLFGIGVNYSIFARSTDWSRAHEDTAAPDIRPLLQFAIATFDPLEGLPPLPEQYVIEEPDGYFIVQFNSSINAQKTSNVEALGGTVLDFIPTFGMIVRLPHNDAAALRAMPGVRWVGNHQPAFRVDILLLCRTGDLALKVSTYRNALGVSARIQAIGGTPGSETSSVLTVLASASILPQIARIPDVKFIEPVLKAGFWNDIARGITRVNTTNEVYGLTGKGQIIAIADSGLDTGNDSDHQPDNPDFTGRVVRWYNVSGELLDDGLDYTDDTNGHGTHVTGTAVGGGNASNRLVRGVAPEASIVVQACGDGTTGSGLYIYNDMVDLFGPPYDDGARVHSNSWGYSNSSYYGKYVEACYQTDYFMYNNTTMLVVFAAGNNGNGSSNDSNTTSPPATAKNVLNVGASESYRPELDTRGDNASHIAVFSSRGGTLDGRIKPDIVAPGTWILSSLSSATTNTGWGFFDENYIWMSGTSQATPHVSGAAILARQYFVECEGIEPSSALLKATLINGADDIGTADIPNMNEGWGRLNLTNCLFPEKPRVMRYVDNTTGFESGSSSVVLNYTAGRAGVVLKFTLVWTDYPGSSAAAQSAPKLVNNLDLNVTAPDGTKFRGNVFANGYSTSGGSNDILNNVECVYFKAPEAGTYSVNITPHTITNGPQPFALVISGELVPDLNVTGISVDPASPAGGDDVWLNATIENCGSEELPPLFRDHFSSQDPGTRENITDVAFSPGGDFALLVGANRTVVRYTTSTGAFTTIDTSKCPWTDFWGVAFNPKNHAANRTHPEALLVGTNGTIVDYNGTGFRTVSGPAGSETLLDVAWNDNGTRALIVGKGGKVYTFPNVSSAFSDDFESGDGSWTFAGGTKWANVTDQNVSPDHSMHCQYGKSASGSKYYIYTGDKNLTNDTQRSAYLEFQQRYKTPVVSGNIFGHRGELYVRVDRDGLDTWPYIARLVTASGNTIGWEKQTFDLYGYYPTSKFRLRFSVASTNLASDGDWWIDDVFINRTHYASAPVSTPGATDMRGVQFIPGTDLAIIVGDDGVVWKYSGGSISAIANSGTDDLRAVAFKPLNSTALLVGDAGTVLRYLGNNDTVQALVFPDNSVSFWDIAFKPGFSRDGPKPDSSQALLVGASGAAWQYFGYDDHFEQASTGSSKTLCAVAFNVSRHPVYGPGLVVGYGSDPVVLKDQQTREFRPFIVDFYRENSSHSLNWLGRAVVNGGLEPDPYPPCGKNVTVSYLWKNAPAGTYNVTARVDITNNESTAPPVPDRVHEVEEWANNQLSMSVLLVPEFNDVVVPAAGLVAIFIAINRLGPGERTRSKKRTRGRKRPPERIRTSPS